MTAVTPILNLHTERQEATRTGFSVRTLQAWRCRGDGPPYLKVGRAVRYDPRAVDAWLGSKARIHTSDPGTAAG